MTFLKYIFSSPWIFIGFVVLCCIFVEFVKVFVGEFFDFIVRLIHGDGEYNENKYFYYINGEEEDLSDEDKDLLVEEVENKSKPLGEKNGKKERRSRK